MPLADDCLLSSTQSYNNMVILDSSVQNGGQENTVIKKSVYVVVFSV